MNSRIRNNQIKLSIIMPVYNTEKYVERCLDSILAQTYKNIELIVVDDCSKGDIKERIKKYMLRDERVQFISNEKNKGLFQARLIGASRATGDYIAFIDSDDYVSLDYYHTLLEAALSKKTDIVIGKTVFQKMDGTKYIRNLHDACFSFEKLEGEDVQKHYFGQRGLCYSWHTIWNKIYTKKLWDKCVGYYGLLTGHIIMTEDIAFSSVLFYFANSVATVSNDAYFYCANESASTNMDEVSYVRFEKNMSDMQAVFDFVEQFLNRIEANEQYKDDFHEWRKYYARMWRHMPKDRFEGKDAKKATKVMDSFCADEHRTMLKDDNFFERVVTQWNSGLETQKELIINSTDEFVSFDIFDTLIVRPFYNPTDLFYLMEEEFEKLVDVTVPFYQVRVDAENYTRQQCGKQHPEWEDVTIDEIYEGMGKLLHLSSEVTNRLKEKEKELEIQFCRARNSGKELYETAKLMGKKILIVSDMYLDMETIQEILRKNGYEEYDKIYLSSKTRKTKHTGNLFKLVRSDIGVTKEQHIYHIGDTWVNDYENAKQAYFDPLFFPKAKEVFENKIQGMQTNECAFIAEKVLGTSFNKTELHKSLGYNCMLALVCNEYFDNPYRSFHAESDFNVDPYLIGYYTLGMHLIGLVSWILSNCKDRKVNTIHFLARDGFLVMKAYQLLTGNHQDAPQVNYLYASRRAVLPGMIQSVQGFYYLPIEYRNHSPKTLLTVLKFAFDEKNNFKIKQLCEKNGFLYDTVFASQMQYIHFMDFFLQNLYDENVLKKNQLLAKEYYSCIGENDITFDMGYSGRIQTAISNLLGRGIGALFVHREHKLSGKMQRVGGYEISSYYDYVPFVSGLLREHVLSDYGPTCIGFCGQNGQAKPVMEQAEKIYQDCFIVDTIQIAALEFVSDYCQTFEQYEHFIDFNLTEVSLPFEGYLCESKAVDREIFSASYFEDMVYGAAENINIRDFMNATIPIISDEKTEMDTAEIVQIMKGKSKLAKMVVYFCVDRQWFWNIVKIKVRRMQHGHYRE